MGFVEILAIVFILLKAFNLVTWSWLIVLAPLLFILAIYVIMFVLSLYEVFKKIRRMKYVY